MNTAEYDIIMTYTNSESSCLAPHASLVSLHMTTTAITRVNTQWYRINCWDRPNVCWV